MSKNDYIPYFTELKKRILKCFFLYLVFITPLIIYAGPIYTVFATPLLNILPANNHLVATHITSSFMVPIKLALFLGLFISIPYFLGQIWGFVTPALYAHEKKPLKTILFFSISLFYIGIIFAYSIVCPLTFGFFTNMMPAGVVMMTDMGHYLDFVLKLMFTFGLTFQTPVILIFLLYSRITTIESLTAKRPYIIIGSFILGMLLTPPDVLSQILLALPLWGLFELGLWIAKRLKLNVAVFMHDVVP